MTSTRMARGLAGLAAIVLCLATGVAEAQRSPEVDQKTRAITHSVMSPFCPGLLLADCPSEYARELRVEIEARVTKGESADAIEGDLVRRFGEQIRTEPGFYGIGVLAWLGPPVAAVIGLLVIVRTARAAMAAAAAATTAAQTPDGQALRLGDAMEHRLQDELDELD